MIEVGSFLTGKIITGVSGLGGSARVLSFREKVT
jgi:hypothetical protein